MPRTPVINRLAEILADSGRTDAECIVGFTHRALAARVYDTQNPTAAQLSAVRRAVARLVAAGRAERGRRVSAWEYRAMSWLVDLPEGQHYRRGEIAYNPGGTVIFRTPTEEDREARDDWLKAEGHDHLREAKQTIERNR